MWIVVQSVHVNAEPTLNTCIDKVYCIIFLKIQQMHLSVWLILLHRNHRFVPTFHVVRTRKQLQLMCLINARNMEHIKPMCIVFLWLTAHSSKCCKLRPSSLRRAWSFCTAINLCGFSVACCVCLYRSRWYHRFPGIRVLQLLTDKFMYAFQNNFFPLK
jgi:hypothetical protein